MALIFVSNPVLLSGRGANRTELGVSRGRKKIQSVRDQRRKVDLQNAIKMKNEMMRNKEQTKK